MVTTVAGKTIKLEAGTVYKKTADGCYFYRYQINGQRKAISLQTKNQDEAVAKAKEITPVVKATTTEVISAHVKIARGLAIKRKSLALKDVWDVYIKHPDRATPATVSEQDSYKATFNEFVSFIGNDVIEMSTITPEMTDKFAQHMRTQGMAVDTHNRKIRRLKKIFEALKTYRDGDNPFIASSLRRKEREEQDNNTRRLSFSREQELSLLKVLDDPRYKLTDKSEMKVIFYLGMFTGQRFKDCIMLRWDRVDMNRKRIWVKQFKTGKEVTIPMASQLFNVLEEAQSWKQNEYVCPHIAGRYNHESSTGKNTGNNLVNLDATKVIRWIGIETSIRVKGRDKKVTVYGFHSLRHSFASHCAEAGIPKAVVLSILGTNSEIVDKYYTHIGDEAQEKAIQALAGTFTTVSDRERINKVLALIDACREKSEIVQQIEQLLRNS